MRYVGAPVSGEMKAVMPRFCTPHQDAVRLRAVQKLANPGQAHVHVPYDDRYIPVEKRTPDITNVERPLFKAPYERVPGLPPIDMYNGIAFENEGDVPQEATLQYHGRDVEDFFDNPVTSWLNRHYIDMKASQVGTIEPKTSEAKKEQRAERRRHEKAVLTDMQARKEVTIIEKHPQKIRQQDTLAAMKHGDKIIHKAAIANTPFVDTVEYIARVDNPKGVQTIIDGRVCNYHYMPVMVIPYNTVTPRRLIRLCIQAWMLEGMQGFRPETVGIITGVEKDGKFQRLQFKTDDYFTLTMHCMNGFLEQMENFDPNDFPFPGQATGDRWEHYVREFLKETNDVRMLPGLDVFQASRLFDEGIRTVNDLAATRIKSIPHMNRRSFEVFKRMARLVIQSRESGRLEHEIIDDLNAATRCLSTLPNPSVKRQDIFMTLESVSHNGSICYGMTYTHHNNNTAPDSLKTITNAKWAIDHNQERNNFVSLMNTIIARHRRDRTMHVYYHGQYDLQRLRDLSVKHGLFEKELDQLIKNHVFVNLRRVFQDSITTSSDSLELGALAALFHEGPQASLGREELNSLAGFMFDVSDKGLRRKTFERVRAGIKSDARLLYELFHFLSDIKQQTGATYQRPPRPKGPPLPYKTRFDRPNSTTIKNKNTPRLTRRLETALNRAGRQSSPARTSEEYARVAALSEHLLQFDIRELRAWYAGLANRASQTPLELIEDPTALGGMERIEGPLEGEKDGTKVFVYRFEPQQGTRVQPDQYCFVTNDLRVKVRVLDIDYEQGIVRLRITDNMLNEKAGGTLPEEIALLPETYVSAQLKHDALYRYFENLANGTLSPLGEALIYRDATKAREWDGGIMKTDEGHRAGNLLKRDVYDVGEDGEYELTHLANNLDNSYLRVQGLPGSGKTTMAAARTIIKAFKEKKKIACSGLTHKSLNNLALKVAELAREEGLEINIAKVDDGGEHRDERLAAMNDGTVNVSFYRTGETMANHKDEAHVTFATPFIFARDDFEGQYDLLIVDEAGQISISDGLLLSNTTKNMVLIGDQRQTGTPTAAVHPLGAGDDIYTYLLKGLHGGRVPNVIDREDGVFLYKSHRIPEATAGFVSPEFYDGQLEITDKIERKLLWKTGGDEIEINGRLARIPGSGIVPVPVNSTGNKRQNREEALATRTLIGSALRATLSVTENGQEPVETPLSPADIMVLSGFNAQAELLRRSLVDDYPEVTTSTIHRIQGQEAPVAIVSLTVSGRSTNGYRTSSRGRNFVLSDQLLNVGLTRAQTTTFVLYDPVLLDDKPGSLKEMKALNRLAKLHYDYAAEGV